MTAHTLKVGDRVVVESPVYCRERYTHATDYITAGDTGTVTSEADNQGDVEVAFEHLHYEEYVSEAGVLKIDDLDHLAAERAPSTTLGTVTVRLDVRVFVGDVEIGSGRLADVLKALS